MNIPGGSRGPAIGLMMSMFLACVPTLAADAGQAPPGSNARPPESAAPMSNARLDKLIRRIDKDAKGQAGYWEFTVEGRVLVVVTDESADRMRIMTPAAKAEGLDDKQLYRLMQANFDSALDARYAVAKNLVWSVFLHPLRSLTPGEFVSGVGQVVNLAESYGSHYSSGLLMFRGGDSEAQRRQRDLIDRLLKKI